MQLNDFVYDAIYKGALNIGANVGAAQHSAVMGANDYKKGRFARKVSHLIEDRIKEAKKNSKKGR